MSSTSACYVNDWLGLQATLWEKTKQMEAVVGELNMHIAHSNEHRYPCDVNGW